MAQSISRLPAAECARRGREIYEREIQGKLAESHYGQVVAIDVDTGAFEVAGDTLSAGDRLRQRVPSAQIWLTRVGHDTLHRMGAGADRRVK